MNRITATLKELVAEVIGDGKMFDKARQEKAGDGMIPPPNLRPMKDFNPAEPAITMR
jgi:hypothetical protein